MNTNGGREVIRQHVFESLQSERGQGRILATISVRADEEGVHLTALYRPNKSAPVDVIALDNKKDIEAFAARIKRDNNFTKGWFTENGGVFYIDTMYVQAIDEE